MNIRSLNPNASDIAMLAVGLIAGIAIGLSYRRGQVQALREMNFFLLKENDKKTWHLGKQFAEYIKKTRM